MAWPEMAWVTPLLSLPFPLIVRVRVRAEDSILAQSSTLSLCHRSSQRQISLPLFFSSLSSLSSSSLALSISLTGSLQPNRGSRTFTANSLSLKTEQNSCSPSLHVPNAPSTLPESLSPYLPSCLSPTLSPTRGLPIGSHLRLPGRSRSGSASSPGLQPTSQLLPPPWQRRWQNSPAPLPTPLPRPHPFIESAEHTRAFFRLSTRCGLLRRKQRLRARLTSR
mmetsp:Transcript_22264/g.87714  ORF Transcript_22264/g.87714 Transcript_22264/m.87714 type:complete len:222 (+) Transcript_22264:1774-2439(+)